MGHSSKESPILGGLAKSCGSLVPHGMKRISKKVNQINPLALLLIILSHLASPRVKVKSFPRHYALGSHEGLYGQCLNLVSVVRSNLECSYTDSPGRDTSPNSVCTHLQLSRLRQSRVNEIA